MNTAEVNEGGPSMSFTLDEGQRAIRESAATVFAKLCTDERIAQVERSQTAYDERLWQAVTEAGLLEAVLPEATGGAGTGMIGAALVLAEQGRGLGAVPLLGNLVAGLAMAQATPGQHEALSQLITGDMRVAIVLADGERPPQVSEYGNGSRLSGKVGLSWHAAACTHLLVVADGPGLWLIERAREGVSLDVYPGLSRLQHAAVSFTDVQVHPENRIRIATTGAADVDYVRQHIAVAVAALQVGVCQEAVRRTARYVSERKQFERPLSTNQGVAIRAADAYIDTETMRLTLLNAAWRLSEGVDATQAVLIARWWASEGTFRVVHATQHLHGGLGADLDNYIHRFFLWGRELDLLGGSAPVYLAELGEQLAVTDAPALVTHTSQQQQTAE